MALSDITKITGAWKRLEKITKDHEISDGEQAGFLEAGADLIDGITGLLAPFIRDEYEGIARGFAEFLRLVAKGV